MRYLVRSFHFFLSSRETPPSILRARAPRNGRLCVLLFERLARRFRFFFYFLSFLLHFSMKLLFPWRSSISWPFSCDFCPLIHTRGCRHSRVRAHSQSDCRVRTAGVSHIYLLHVLCVSFISFWFSWVFRLFFLFQTRVCFISFSFSY